MMDVLEVGGWDLEEGDPLDGWGGAFHGGVVSWPVGHVRIVKIEISCWDAYFGWRHIASA